MILRVLKPFLILAFFIFAIGLACIIGGAETKPAVEPAGPTPDLNATAQILAQQLVVKTQAAQLVVTTPEPTAVIEEPTLTSVEPTIAPPTESGSSNDLPDAIKQYFTGAPGEYRTLGDFDQSWAQIGWYQWWPIEGAPANFVIRSDTTWSSASDTANWDQSGCGFAFHAKDAKNHFAAYLGLDGNVYVQRNYNGQAKLLGSPNYGKVDVPEGSAELMLMVNGDNYYFFVNGKEVYSGSDPLLTGALKGGELGLTVNSGTNKGYGTRCQMEKIEMWDLGK
jgi:hypothetical protein